MVICDKEDCPIYNCYFNPENYAPFKQKLEEYEKSVEKAPNKYSNDIRSTVSTWMEQTNIKISIACLSCKYFERQDMYTNLLSEEAKDVLTSK